MARSRGRKDKSIIIVIGADNQATNVIEKVKLGLKDFEAKSGDTSRKMASDWRDTKASYLRSAAAMISATYALKAALNFSKQGARITDLQGSFARLGGSIRTMEKLRAAVNDAVDDATLQRFHNMANQLGINSQQFERLLKISRAASKVLDLDLKYAIESITTGTARQSKLWLDNLGILISIDEANKRYAISIGKTVKALDDAEKKQAFINEVIRQGNDLIGKAGQGGSAADSWNQMAAEITNAANALKQKMAPVMDTAIKFWIPALAAAGKFWFSSWGEGAENVRKSVTDLLRDEIEALRVQVKNTGNFEYRLELLNKIIQKRRQLAKLEASQLDIGQGKPGPPPVPGRAQLPPQAVDLERDFSKIEDARSRSMAAQQELLENERQLVAERIAIQEQLRIHTEVTEDARRRQMVASQQAIVVQAAVEREQRAAMVESTRMGFQALATMFPKMKAFAIAEAVVSTYQAITNALATKPFIPMGLAMAGLAAARGFAAVKAIKSQGVSTGGGTSTYSYGGAVATVPQAQAPPAPTNITIEAHGLGDSGLIGMTPEDLALTISKVHEASGMTIGNITYVAVRN